MSLELHKVFDAMDQAGWTYDWEAKVFRKSIFECSYEAAEKALAAALAGIDRQVAANEP